MKLSTWIDSKVENMHVVLICLPNINCGWYGNLKLPLAYNESWLVVWGLGPFETVFQSISGRLPERGRKKREMIDERKNIQTNPHPHLLQGQ